MSQDEQWELQFEHIDWNDIVDAELEGDTKALDDLKEKSLEIKRSFSCPSPTVVSPGPAQEIESPLRSTPPAPHRHFKVPHHPSRTRRTPKQRKPRPPRSHPYNHSEQDYPSLPPPTTSHSPVVVSSSPVGYGSPNYGFSYAEATQPRLMGKRSASERICLSPIDFMPKRNALQSTPEPLLATELETTPKEYLSEELMDISDAIETTPGGDSHPSKVMMAAQRRLFPPTNENTSPQRTQRSASVSKLSLHQLAQRQKQIDYGKNTLGYQRYIQTIPKWQRKRSDPMTPDKNNLCSTRAWQGQVKVWRRALHAYDPPNEEGSTQFTSKDAALCGLDSSLLTA